MRVEPRNGVRGPGRPPLAPQREDRERTRSVPALGPWLSSPRAVRNTRVVRSPQPGPSERPERMETAPGGYLPPGSDGQGGTWGVATNLSSTARRRLGAAHPVGAAPCSGHLIRGHFLCVLSHPRKELSLPPNAVFVPKAQSVHLLDWECVKPLTLGF